MCWMSAQSTIDGEKLAFRGRDEVKECWLGGSTLYFSSR